MVRIVSRGSALALVQAEAVERRLSAAWPAERFEVVPIETRGDREIDRPLPEIGGKGLFTEALERALLSGTADIAVHSLKDLPTELPEGLHIGAIAERADPLDAWVTRRGGAGAPHPQEAPPGSRIGTSSERRRALLMAVRDDLDIASVRGNVDTRLRKLDDGLYDGLLMAAAGLERLGFADRITCRLEPPFWIPAPGQGAVAVESRVEDERMSRLLISIEDPTARAEVVAERSLLAALEGGCQVPIGALARAAGETLSLQAFIALPDGSRLIRGERRGKLDAPAAVGQELAEQLLSLGGDAIVVKIREESAAR